MARSPSFAGIPRYADLAAVQAAAIAASVPRGAFTASYLTGTPGSGLRFGLSGEAAEEGILYPPPAIGWTDNLIGPAVVSTARGHMTISAAPYAAGRRLCLRRRSLGANGIELCYASMCRGYSTGYLIGVGLRESSSGKIAMFSTVLDLPNVRQNIVVQYWTSATAYSADVGTNRTALQYAPLWTRLYVSGGYVVMENSGDGDKWVQQGRYALTSFGSMTPDEMVVGLSDYDSTGTEWGTGISSIVVYSQRDIP